MKARLMTALLAAALTLTACGTGAGDHTTRPPAPKDEVHTIKEIAYTDDMEEGVADFGIRLLSAAAAPGENTLISPLSVASALGMTMNGADGETLREMETVLGMEAGALARWCSRHREGWEESGELLLANAIWVNKDRGLALYPDFLKADRESYGAEIFSEPFTDKTADEINAWVKQNTDGTIPEILDEVPEEAVMYLVNALSFEAEWPAPYEEHQVQDGSFTTAAGEESTVSFLHGREDMLLETEKAVGFLKPYKDSRYAFGVLLPNEGLSLEELLQSLDGRLLKQLISAPVRGDAILTAIPKFETEHTAELSEILSAMGMPGAFTKEQADFSRMADPEHELFLSRVLHRTFLSLGEQGTRAGAATAVEVKMECAPMETREVILDRPFLYFIVDQETGTPLFLGTMNDPTA